MEVRTFEDGEKARRIGQSQACGPLQVHVDVLETQGVLFVEQLVELDQEEGPLLFPFGDVGNIPDQGADLLFGESQQILDVMDGPAFENP